MKLRILLFINFLATHFISYSQNVDKDRTIELPEISKELISMSDNDQKYRYKWAKLINEGKTKSNKFKRRKKSQILN